jgi:hypothetical protein
MPVTDFHYNDHIFSAREVGHIDKSDAERWVEALRQNAAASPTPIVALIDAQEVTFVSAGARMAFAEASKTPNLQAICVITQDMLITQTVRVIGMLGERGRTHVFETIDDAREFAQDTLVQFAKEH